MAYEGPIVTAGNGGTGNNSYSIGDILYANATTPTLTPLHIGAGGTVLHGGTTPSYSAVSLTADVTGVLPSANGGTGVSNSGTLTLGGSLVTSGAFTSTFTMTGNTTVTFPTSGTLLTSSGAVTSITATSPLAANSMSGSPQTGAVTLTINVGTSFNANDVFTYSYYGGL